MPLMSLCAEQGAFFFDNYDGRIGRLNEGVTRVPEQLHMFILDPDKAADTWHQAFYESEWMASVNERDEPLMYSVMGVGIHKA